MRESERLKFIAKNGAGAYLALDAKKKRMERMKRQLATARHVSHGFVAHPLNCLCYDCQWGEVAEARRAVDNPKPGRRDLTDEWRFAKRGRVSLRLA